MKDYFNEVELKLEFGLVVEINRLAKEEQIRLGYNSSNMINEIVKKTDDLIELELSFKGVI
ncbi:MAG: hypothetical protein U9N34_06300 [Candidatus Cloacimonadota bacterium]|nr:hypothetical protein [Candidatus Cloacimonadota bacterium]